MYWKENAKFPQKSLIGMTFGAISVLDFYGRDKHNDPLWWCQCGCRRHFRVKDGNLKSGNTKHCKKCSYRMMETNPECTDRELYRICYNRARCAENRCNDPTNKRYHLYKGLWHFESILECAKYLYDLAIEQGLDADTIISEKYQIDKIDDELGYVRENIQWLTGIENRRKRKCTPWVTYNGERMTLIDFSRMMNIPYATVWKRYSRFGDNIKELTRPQNVIYFTGPDGKDYTMKEIADLTGFNIKMIQSRYESGATTFEELTRPSGTRRREYGHKI